LGGRFSSKRIFRLNPEDGESKNEINKRTINMSILELDKVDGRERFKLLAEMMDSLYDRKGFADWWNTLDSETENEIEKELLNIMDRRLNKHKFEKLTPEQEKNLKALKKSMKSASQLSDFLSDPERLKKASDSFKEAVKDYTIMERDENGKYIKKEKK
jgi:Lon protease-like protein